MRLFGATGTALAAARDVQAAASILPAPRPAAVTIGTDDIPGLLGGWMTRDTAMMVPAFARGLDLITGIASGFPLLEFGADGSPVQPLGFTSAPSYEAGIPRVTTIRRTVADLVCEGKAYWVTTRAQAVTGYPAEVQRVDPINVTRDRDGWTVNGHHVDAGRVIEFDLGLPGALDSGWYTLRTALSLEAAANNYASEPLPAMALVSQGVDLDETEAEELLGKWAAARRKRSTAYLNSQVTPKEFGWNAAELQLVEARAHAAAEVARLLNLDPVWVGANAAGQSLTYQNKQDQNQQLLDATIMPLLRVIEQRLSMLSAGREFRFDTLAFLRANLSERVAALTAYLAAGVITEQEARDLEPMIRKGALPA